ncbi:MAG: hypothetical protein AMXMBFR79_08010 [Chitinophagaceae bacterium]|nr:hypothetical protein [Chitinophagaceae bacterium]
MTQFILNIPSEKVQKFLAIMVQVHLSNTIKNVINEQSKKHLQLMPVNNGLKTQHPYFDAEFYVNDIFE